MCDTCGDNRFELIEKYKQKLIESTNISNSPEEMAVIDNILFRFWQMGWLKGEMFGISEQLEQSHKKDHFADPGKMVGDLISRAEAIETVRKAKSIGQAHRMLVQLPSAQSELVRKIYAIGYTGKEGRIYIGGRLFAVRELAQ